jgi:hypothetical protein
MHLRDNLAHGDSMGRNMFDNMNYSFSTFPMRTKMNRFDPKKSLDVRPLRSVNWIKD